MKYAIDRFKIGYEEEVSADEFHNTYIPQRKTRFFCPECGEPVFWRKRGGAQPNKFCHYTRTVASPECDKRVDGKSELNLYQRVGLPMCLSRSGESQFSIHILFPAIGEKNLDTAVNEKYQVCIAGAGRKRVFPIDRTYFQASEITRIPVDFIPSGGENYAIQINAGTEIKKRWSHYSDGFAAGGAFFAYSETGGKKIRRGDSITPGRQYYLIARHFLPIHNEIEANCIGAIRLNQSRYSVYTVSINVSVDDERRYTAISKYLNNHFGVLLLETAPELITLWPPIVEQDVFVPVKNTPAVYCAVSSGNSVPKVFIYSENRTTSIPVHQSASGATTIALPLKKETIVSVDRKYVGREIVFQKKPLPVSNAKFLISIETPAGVTIDLDALTPSVLSSDLVAKSNAKMELYIGSRDKKYSPVSIRASATIVASARNTTEIIWVVENRIFQRYDAKTAYGFQKGGLHLYEKISENANGEYVPAPRWVGFLLKKWQKNGQVELVKAVTHSICNASIPRGILNLLYPLVQCEESMDAK